MCKLKSKLKNLANAVFTALQKDFQSFKDYCVQQNQVFHNDLKRHQAETSQKENNLSRYMEQQVEGLKLQIKESYALMETDHKNLKQEHENSVKVQSIQNEQLQNQIVQNQENVELNLKNLDSSLQELLSQKISQLNLNMKTLRDQAKNEIENIKQQQKVDTQNLQQIVDNNQTICSKTFDNIFEQLKVHKESMDFEQNKNQQVNGDILEFLRKTNLRYQRLNKYIDIQLDNFQVKIDEMEAHFLNEFNQEKIINELFEIEVEGQLDKLKLQVDQNYEEIIDKINGAGKGICSNDNFDRFMNIKENSPLFEQLQKLSDDNKTLNIFKEKTEVQLQKYQEKQQILTDDIETQKQQNQDKFQHNLQEMEDNNTQLKSLLQENIQKVSNDISKLNEQQNETQKTQHKIEEQIEQELQNNLQTQIQQLQDNFSQVTNKLRQDIFEIFKQNINIKKQKTLEEARQEIKKIKSIKQKPKRKNIEKKFIDVQKNDDSIISDSINNQKKDKKAYNLLNKQSSNFVSEKSNNQSENSQKMSSFQTSKHKSVFSQENNDLQKSVIKQITQNTIQQDSNEIEENAQELNNEQIQENQEQKQNSQINDDLKQQQSDIQLSQELPQENHDKLQKQDNKNQSDQNIIKQEYSDSEKKEVNNDILE